MKILTNLFICITITIISCAPKVNTKYFRLMVRDFKASSNNRLFPAKSYFSIKYHIEDAKGKRKWWNLFVSTVFHAQRSYINENMQVDNLLRNQQNHFNIAEIHARMITKEFEKSEFKNVSDLNVRFEDVSSKIIDEMDQMHDKYEMDLSKDSTSIDKWEIFIHNKLDELSEYSDKKAIFKLN